MSSANIHIMLYIGALFSSKNIENEKNYTGTNTTRANQLSLGYV